MLKWGSFAGNNMALVLFGIALGGIGGVSGCRSGGAGENRRAAVAHQIAARTLVSGATVAPYRSGRGMLARRHSGGYGVRRMVGLLHPTLRPYWTKAISASAKASRSRW